MGIRVRLAGKADAATIGEVFARAFANDPVTSWVTPDAERRARLLRRLNFLIARYEGVPRGATYVAEQNDRVIGAAIWQPPGRAPVSWRSIPFALQAGGVIGRSIPRMTHAGRAAARAREKNSWYLQLLGVDPDAQGTGVGTALVREHLVTVDANAERACLETTVENLKFYGRLGFDVDHPLEIAPGAPAEYALRRPARVH